MCTLITELTEGLDPTGSMLIDNTPPETSSMTTGKQSWHLAHPVAEIHWTHTAVKYGFNETESMRRYWKSACTKDTTVSFIPGNRVIALTSEDGERKLVPYMNTPQLRVYLRLGYRPTGPRFVYKKGSIGVIRLIHEDSAARPTSFVLVCVDTLKMKILGSFAVTGYGGQTNFHHIEVYGVSVSVDRKHIAFSLGLVHECDFLHEAYENAVVIYNCATMREVYRVNVGQIIAAVAFDPCSNYTFSIAGIPDSYGAQTIATFSLTSGELLMSTPISQLLDAEEETHLEISYSKEGSLLVLQTLEPVGYSQEWLYNTYLYNVDNLEPIARCGSSLLMTCHSQCMPIAAPQVSPCGSHMAMTNHCMNQKAPAPIKVYRLPCSLNLMKQCRAVIIRSLKKTADIKKLPLPSSLKMYLSLDKVSIGKEPARKETSCQCPKSTGNEDVKDASWFKSIDDVTCDPELSEIPLHPRARNETYS